MTSASSPPAPSRPDTGAPVRVHQPTAEAREAIVRFEPKARKAAPAPVAVPVATMPPETTAAPAEEPGSPLPVREIGGRKDGPEPTRYGDWEFKGRCIDF